MLEAESNDEDSNCSVHPVPPLKRMALVSARASCACKSSSTSCRCKHYQAMSSYQQLSCNCMVIGNLPIDIPVPHWAKARLSSAFQCRFLMRNSSLSPRALSRSRRDRVRAWKRSVGPLRWEEVKMEGRPKRRCCKTASRYIDYIDIEWYGYEMDNIEWYRNDMDR